MIDFFIIKLSIVLLYMPGGLVQLTTYGSQDLFLTGTPEITFFKTVYRRHTNFVIESIVHPFDSPVGFGKESTLTVQRIGDLIHKTYLQITLPEIKFRKTLTQQDPQIQLNFDTARINYAKILMFMKINREAYIAAYEICSADNIDDPCEIIDIINAIFDTLDPDFLTEIEQLINDYMPKFPYTFDNISIKNVIENFLMDCTQLCLDPYPYPDCDNEFDKELCLIHLDIAITKSITTQQVFFNQMKNTKLIYEDSINDCMKFAWVDRVGYAIIDEIEVRIGGSKIDRHYGDWLNIWHELSTKQDLTNIHDKMIGNIKVLTDFNRSPKPEYQLTIPLEFWFCRHNGNALPLIALQYHDITFHVKFRNIEDVSYIENNQTILSSKENCDNELYLDEVPCELNLDIKANMLIDYVWLDGPERRKFATVSHEYLIEQLQMVEERDITTPDPRFILDNFVHPSKELIWRFQKQRYTENESGYTKLQWHNYSLTDDNVGNPIKTTRMSFNSHDRIHELEGNYFNYVQPYETHTKTPSDGINMYSFALAPEESQPSGSANLSRISRNTLFIKLKDTLFTEGPNSEKHIFRAYTRNHNILRLISGMGALSWTYG